MTKLPELDALSLDSLNDCHQLVILSHFQAITTLNIRWISIDMILNPFRLIDTIGARDLISTNPEEPIELEDSIALSNVRHVLMFRQILNGMRPVPRCQRSFKFCVLRSR